MDAPGKSRNIDIYANDVPRHRRARAIRSQEEGDEYDQDQDQDQDHDHDHNTNLPWYLKGNDVNILPKIAVGGNDCSDMGDGIPVGIDIDIDRHVECTSTGGAERMHKHTHEYESIKRRKKRSRFDFENDAAFTPFTGSIDDLVEKSNTFPISNEFGVDNIMLPMGGFARIGNYLRGWNLNLFITLLLVVVPALLLFVWMVQKFVFGTSRGHNSVSSSYDDVVVVPDRVESEEDDKCSTEANGKSFKPHNLQQKHVEEIELNNHTNIHERMNDHDPQGGQDEQNVVEYSGDANSNDCMTHLQKLSTEIPAIAKIIERTGLSHQDSLKIATQEVLAAQRRAVEAARKEDERVLECMRKEANEVLGTLHDFLVSTAIGRKFIVNVGIGCTCRFLMSNRHLLNGQDSSKVFETIYNWFLVDICGCIDATCREDPVFINTMTNGNVLAMYALAYIGFPSFSSKLIGTCVIKSLAKISLFGVMHKFFRLFHSKFLHQILNLLMAILFVINTDAGRSTVQLASKIFSFNLICCSVTYYGLFHYHLHSQTATYVRKASQVAEKEIEELRRVIGRTRRMTTDLLIISSIGSMVLGLLSIV